MLTTSGARGPAGSSQTASRRRCPQSGSCRRRVNPPRASGWRPGAPHKRRPLEPRKSNRESNGSTESWPPAHTGDGLSREDLDWLNADPRHKRIAYDPDIGTYRVSEARQAIAAEQSRVLPAPVTRSTQPGTDLLDGAGVAWSVKGIGPSSTV
jgi:hypothetical protein